MTRIPVAVFAQDSPTQSWVTGWVGFLRGMGVLILVVVIMAVGLWILVRRTLRVTIAAKDGRATHFTRRGGVRAAVVFGLGAALVLWLLTHVDAVAEFLRAELPIGRR